jgi:hypothetical protein
VIAQESLLLPARGRTKPPLRRICDARPPTSDVREAKRSSPETAPSRAAQSVRALAKTGREPAKGGGAITNPNARRMGTAVGMHFWLGALLTVVALLASSRAFGHAEPFRHEDDASQIVRVPLPSGPPRRAQPGVRRAPGARSWRARPAVSRRASAGPPTGHRSAPLRPVDCHVAPFHSRLQKNALPASPYASLVF